MVVNMISRQSNFFIPEIPSSVTSTCNGRVGTLNGGLIIFSDLVQMMLVFF